MNLELLIPLLSALVGAIIGAAASVITIWIQQSAQSKREKMKLSSEIALADYKLRYENLKEYRSGVAMLPLASWQHLHYEVLTALEKGNLTEDDVIRIWKENGKIEKLLVKMQGKPNKVMESDA